MTYVDELRQLSHAVRRAAEAEKEAEIRQPLENAERAAETLAQSWSGSPIGYHSRVYYGTFSPPPPGAHFNSEWGLYEGFFGSTGDWQEYSIQQINDKLRELQDGTSLADISLSVKATEEVFIEAQHEVKSILSSILQARSDSYLEKILQEVDSVSIMHVHELSNALLPRGQFMSRDSAAISQGLKLPQHQHLWTEAAEVRSTFEACRKLRLLIDRSANHLDRKIEGTVRMGRQVGERIFIGHGRSAQWRELKDFIDERLALPWDEFNRVPVAGVTTVSRLTEMLDRAAFAFLIMTAEDEVQEGDTRARQNVIHEVGLFQGRLGFERAIVMLEEGCAEFSNIDGLSQIRFPAGNIGARFEDVRRVLEREGLLDT
ncbi:TIR domain-containing protein [Actinomadura nitritigenes]|uniref:TIR domain-containing protein n=1 Tax=Actinomadura nitritigenes TaxID=134602 RepID=UPI003D8AB1C0